MIRTNLYPDPYIFFRWSAIAARLPGRTDNEIKNVWHTHLKKKLKQHQDITASDKRNDTKISTAPKCYHEAKTEVESMNFPSPDHPTSESPEHRPVSPQECSSEMSTVTTGDNSSMYPKVESPGDFPEVDENFWAEVLWTDNSGVESDFSAVCGDQEFQIPFSPIMTMEPVHPYGSNMQHDNMDFWFDIFTRTSELPDQLP